MNNENYNKIKNWLEDGCGAFATITINYDGGELTGLINGNDECFDLDDFFQYFLTPDALYKAYYAIPEGVTDLNYIDYSKPYKIAEVDTQYLLDYVI